MPRAPRTIASNVIYHVFTHGVDDRDVFSNDVDRTLFVKLLAHVVRTYAWRCFIVTLLDTHYHLLAQTTEPNIDRGMQYLNGVYGQKFNRANGRRGHLWQSRYHDRISTSDAEFLERYRYIALNAVEAGECDDPADYVWCSFGGTVAVAPPWRFVSDDLVLSRFGTGRDGIARLRDFVDERQLVRERHREIARRLGLAA